MPYSDPEVRKSYERERQRKCREGKRLRGECARCKNKALEGQTLCEEHKQYVLDANIKSINKDPNRAIKWRQKARRNLRDEVLDHYGRVCACCGESHDEFLTIDHINGDGAEHRKNTTTLYRWLRANGFPEGFRTLCANCNLAMGIHGICPHGNLPFQKTNHPHNVLNQELLNGHESDK